MRMRWAVVLALVLACGCGKDESVVKYDGLQDTSSSSLKLSSAGLGDPPKVGIEMSVLFWGKGKHPTPWHALITVSVLREPNTPAILGQKPKLKVFPGAGYDEVVIEDDVDDYGKSSTRESASFGINVDVYDGHKGLVAFASGDGRFELNGKPYTLSEEDREKIKERIIALREVSNAGK